MSAGSRKKHNNSHKQYQGGSQDHLEVESLLAGAGNGRDVEERLSAGVKAAEALDPAVRERLDKAVEGVTNLPTNEQGMVNADDLVKAGSELNESLKQIANPAPPEDGIMGGVPGIGNEGPVTAGNVDTPARDYTNIWEAAPKRYLVDMPYRGENVVAFVLRTPKAELFGEDFGPTLKEMLELHPYEIVGLKSGFKIGEFTKTQQRTQYAPSMVTVAVVERQGRVIDSLMIRWAERYNDYLLDAEQARDNRSYKAKIQAEDVTVDVMFVELDESNKNVLMAWKGTNLYPSRYSGIDSARRVHERGHECVYFDLSGNYQRGVGVNNEAQELVGKLAAEVSEQFAAMKVAFGLA